MMVVPVGVWVMTRWSALLVGQHRRDLKQTMVEQVRGPKALKGSPAARSRRLPVFHPPAYCEGRALGSLLSKYRLVGFFLIDIKF